MRIFGGVEPQTESTSPFLYIIIFQKWESFKSPSSPMEGDKTYALADSFVRNSIANNFYLKLFFFWCDTYFCLRRAPNRIYFPILIIGTQKLRCCLFTFMAWYVSIIIGGCGHIHLPSHANWQEDKPNTSYICLCFCFWLFDWTSSSSTENGKHPNTHLFLNFHQNVIGVCVLWDLVSMETACVRVGFHSDKFDGNPGWM